MGFEMLAGLSQRTYIIVPDGNYFINPEKGKTYDDIHYGRTNAFLSVTKTLFDKKLKLELFSEGIKMIISRSHGIRGSQLFIHLFINIIFVPLIKAVIDTPVYSKHIQILIAAV